MRVRAEPEKFLHVLVSKVTGNSDFNINLLIKICAYIPITLLKNTNSITSTEIKITYERTER